MKISLVATEHGGRVQPLSIDSRPEHQFRYRPDWALPGTRPRELSGAWVLSWSRADVLHPGQAAHAVIIPPFPFNVPRWSALEPGTVLPMHEGPRVAGWGRLLWRSPTAWPPPSADVERFTLWLSTVEGSTDRSD